jgi:alpha-ribazole phosphatase
MGNVVVHLIRHEKTEANVKRKYIGWTDESIIIDEKSFHMSIQTKEVYGSDLKRCRETAQLYFPQATFKDYRSFRELNFGDFEMKTYEELKSYSLYRNWIDDPDKFTPPNGEDFKEFVQRVVNCFQQIIISNGEYTFVVHGGVIRTLLSQFTPHEDSFQQLTVSHRTIYSLYWSDILDLKEGKRCEWLSVEPITVKENI